MKLVYLLLVTLVGRAVGDGKEEPHPKLHLPKKTEEKHEFKKEKKESFTTCLNGYTLRNKDKKCVKDISEPVFQPSDVVQVSYLTKCPSGFKDTKKGCSTSVEVEPEYYCPIGWQDAGSECSTIELPEYKKKCYEGDLIDEQCVKIHTTPRVVSSRCPEDSVVESDGNCWRVIATFECDEKKKDKKLTSHEYVERKEKKLRLLGEEGNKEGDKKKDDVKKDKKHVLKEMVSVTPPRKTKVGVATQLCEKKIQVDALALVFCPEGFDEVGEECLRQEVTPPAIICASSGKEGVCPVKQRSAPKYARCPDGSEKEKEKCVEYTFAEPLKVCAPGWNDTGEGCVGMLENKPSAECRPGLTLVDDHCVGQLVRNPITLSFTVPEDCEETKY